MRIINIDKDEVYLILEMDNGSRLKQRLDYRGIENVIKKCWQLKEKGCQVKHSTYGNYDPTRWFLDIWEVKEDLSSQENSINKENSSDVIKSGNVIRANFNRGNTALDFSYDQEKNLSDPISHVQPSVQLNPEASVKVSEENKLDLIRARESDVLEKKATFLVNLHTSNVDDEIILSTVKTVAAFLNTEGGKKGGTLLIGVGDNCEIIGIDQDIKLIPKANNAEKLGQKLDAVEQRLREIFKNWVSGIDKLDVKIDFWLIQEDEKKIICVIKVPPSLKRRESFVNPPKTAKLEKYKDRLFFVRNGNSTVSLVDKDLDDYRARYF